MCACVCVCALLPFVVVFTGFRGEMKRDEKMVKKKKLWSSSSHGHGGGTGEGGSLRSTGVSGVRTAFYITNPPHDGRKNNNNITRVHRRVYIITILLLHRVYLHIAVDKTRKKPYCGYNTIPLCPTRRTCGIIRQ